MRPAQPPKPKRGPPFKPERDRRGVVLKIRLSPAERAIIAQAIAQDVSTWARAVLLETAEKMIG